MSTVDEVLSHTQQAAPGRVVSAPSPAIPLLIMVGADKGGVGKTQVSRAMDDYLQRRRVHRKVYDGQFPKGDLKRFVSNAVIVNLANIDDQMKTFDTVEGVSLLDLSAGSLSPTLKALGDTGLLDDVREGKMALAVLHVLGQSVASLEEVAGIVSTLGAGSHYYPVKNLVSEYGFQEWEADPRFSEILKQLEPVTIHIPHLPSRVNQEVQKLGSSFDAFATSGHQSRMLTGYVKDWLKQTCSEFDRVGLGRLIKGATNAA